MKLLIPATLDLNTNDEFNELRSRFIALSGKGHKLVSVETVFPTADELIDSLPALKALGADIVDVCYGCKAIMSALDMGACGTCKQSYCDQCEGKCACSDWEECLSAETSIGLSAEQVVWWREQIELLA
jgi:hypothetical protein